jgi:hypothetical protein
MSRLSLSTIRKDLSQRELYFFASPVLFIRWLLLVALLALLRSLIRSRLGLQLEIWLCAIKSACFNAR